jgi:hypothetical protein
MQTKPLLRNILAIFLGLLANMIVVTLFEWYNSTQYPMPEGLDINDKAAFAQYAMGLPTMAFVLLIFGFFFGGLAAAIVGAGLCATEPQNKAYITIGVVIAIGVLNFITVPAPTWVIIATMVGYIIAGLLGARIGAQWWASRGINKQ